MAYQRERDVAVTAVRQAASLCRQVQSQMQMTVMTKSDRSPVTIADYGSQALICRQLEQAFAADVVVGEEGCAELRQPEHRTLREQLVHQVRREVSTASDADILHWIDRGGHDHYCDRFWSLDPIDGTKGFLRQDQYAISLALVVNGEIVLGVLGLPNLPIDDPQGPRGVLCVAEKGGGAWQLSLDDATDPVPLRVRSVDDIAQLRLCESLETAHSSHDDSARIVAMLGITSLPLRMDSQAKYAAVARGEAQAYLRLPGDDVYREKIWDHAGGVIVVTEAGGRVTDIHGKPLDFTQGQRLEQNRGVVVTDGTHHDRILQGIVELRIGGEK
jgi:3'(2'), 5'-bisphosphate nucleotidase